MRARDVSYLQFGMEEHRIHHSVQQPPESELFGSQAKIVAPIWHRRESAPHEDTAEAEFIDREFGNLQRALTSLAEDLSER